MENIIDDPILDLWNELTLEKTFGEFHEEYYMIYLFYQLIVEEMEYVNVVDQFVHQQR